MYNETRGLVNKAVRAKIPRGTSMRWYVVLRIVYQSYPPRLLKEISRFRRKNENTWMYIVKDVDYKENTYGFVDVFRREDAARRYYENSKGMDDEGSIYLIFASAFLKRGAARKAIGTILFGGFSMGEILDDFHFEQENENANHSEERNGG
jgi:hypothetical protein